MTRQQVMELRGRGVLMECASMASNSGLRESIRKASFQVAILNGSVEDVSHLTLPDSESLLSGYRRGVCAVSFDTFVRFIRSTPLKDVIGLDDSFTVADELSLAVLERCTDMYVVPCDAFVLPLMSWALFDEVSSSESIVDESTSVATAVGENKEKDYSITVITCDINGSSVKETKLAISVFDTRWKKTREKLLGLTEVALLSVLNSFFASTPGRKWKATSDAKTADAATQTTVDVPDWVFLCCSRIVDACNRDVRLEAGIKELLTNPGHFVDADLSLSTRSGLERLLNEKRRAMVELCVYLAYADIFFMLYSNVCPPLATFLKTSRLDSARREMLLYVLDLEKMTKRTLDLPIGCTADHVANIIFRKARGFTLSFDEDRGKEITREVQSSVPFRKEFNIWLKRSMTEDVKHTYDTLGHIEMRRVGLNVEKAQMGEETKSIISEKQNELIEQQKENHLRFKEQWLHVQNEMIKQHKEVRGKVLQCYYTALEDNDTNS